VQGSVLTSRIASSGALISGSAFVVHPLPPKPSRQGSATSELTDVLAGHSLANSDWHALDADASAHLHPPMTAAAFGGHGASCDVDDAEDLEKVEDLEELVEMWSSLKLETKTLRELRDATQESLQQLETTNVQIHEAALSSSSERQTTTLPATEASGDRPTHDAPLGRASSRPATRIVVEEDPGEEVDEDDYGEGELELLADDDERVVWRTTVMEPYVVDPYLDDDDEEFAFDDDDDAPVYRSIAFEPPSVSQPPARTQPSSAQMVSGGWAAPPPMPPRSQASATPPSSSHEMRLNTQGKRDRDFMSDIAPQMLQPAKQSSNPSARSSPTQEHRKLHELRESIRAERRERAALLKQYHDNEEMLARLQATNTELRRQVALLTGRPLP